MDGQSFVIYVQIFSDEKAASLKSTALVAYPVHVMPIDFTYSFRWWLFENGHTVVGYLPVKRTVVKEVVGVLSKAGRSKRYWFTENKETEMEENSYVGSKTKTRDLRMSLSQAAL